MDRLSDNEVSRAIAAATQRLADLDAEAQVKGRPARSRALATLRVHTSRSARLMTLCDCTSHDQQAIDVTRRWLELRSRLCDSLTPPAAP